MVEKWETLESKLKSDEKIFEIYNVRRKHPQWRREADFVVIDSPQWVNIIPVTNSGEVVLVEQYRQGSDEITLEIPGGLVEPGEAPRKAGERECLEETGFSAPLKAELLGVNRPNPAFMTNYCYSYLWEGVEKNAEQALEGNEDINVALLPMELIPDYILSGKINHSIVLTAFFFYSLQNGF